MPRNPVAHNPDVLLLSLPRNIGSIAATAAVFLGLHQLTSEGHHDRMVAQRQESMLIQRGCFFLLGVYCNETFGRRQKTQRNAQHLFIKIFSFARGETGYHFMSCHRLLSG
ncbi:hypothetical protein GQ44DRAFT_202889 [Phaeosphaeriaceae sp. PMI808]|nr:hypothetical protein GQ44DRAFT_202889 [Phaeosphaeriaceae sp. PMI808]